ncbi:murein transglycosylase domain-containing protein [Thiomicrorhabdus sp.]|uniref:murein transglycosylase domain-containing protein n=1 Tax=Thiomicrorhabdus sp. TaxID=2039724 RepID=UPI00356ABC4C
MKVPMSVAISISSFLLLLIAGGAFSGFENWMKYQNYSKNNQVNQPFVSSGMRMVSNDPMKVKSVPISEVEDVKKTSFESVVPEAVETDRELSRAQDVLNVQSPETEVSESPISTQTAESSLTVIQPTVIIYDDELIVEFPKAVANLRDMKRAISRLLLSDQPFSEDLLSSQALAFKDIPYLYRKVLDQNRRPIRYPAKAFEYADYLLNSKFSETIKDEEGEFVAVHIPLVDPNYPEPVSLYKDWVTDYAKKFDVSPALVFAIMETESGFKPDAVSRSNALGLMQLKPEAAGRDVYQYIDLKEGSPSRKDLFDEKNNIRMGTAYLGLLTHDYLDKVRNKDNKELLAIASYNGGLSTVLKLFGDSEERAIEYINRLHPRQVYRKLRFEHQSDETRRYLDKVMKAKNKYRTIFEV